MRTLLTVYAGLAIGAVIFGLVGFLVWVITQQQGWDLVLGSLGACLGATWAAMRCAQGKGLWRSRGLAPANGALPPGDGV